MGIEPVAQIGKGGITENFIESVDKALSAREIIKITVLQNASEDARDFAEEIAAATNSEVVCVIGKKIVLYRFSDKPGIQHIKF